MRKVWLGLGSAVLAVPVLGWLQMAGIYQLGLTLAPDPPVMPAAVSLPPLVDAAIWARFGGGVERRVEGLTPWTFVALRVCRLQAAKGEDRQQRAEQCLAQQVGLPLAASIAAQHVRDNGPAQGVAARELGQVATAGWLTRTWDADALVRELAQRGDFGAGGRGIEDAARRYFDKTPAALTAPEAATLAAALAGAERWQAGVSPWCAPAEALAARNRVLGRMAVNGAIAAAAVQPMVQQPLAVVDRPCR